MKVATKDALVAFEVVAKVQHLDGRLIVCPPHVALEDAHGLTAHDREGMFDPCLGAGYIEVLAFHHHGLADVGTVAVHDHVARLHQSVVGLTVVDVGCDHHSRPNEFG